MDRLANGRCTVCEIVIDLDNVWSMMFMPLCSEFFIPGMVDTHIHASQYTYSGTHLDLPLLDWLKIYTFPVELRYKDLDFAKDVYTKVVVSCNSLIVFL